MSRSSLSILIPAYNESATLGNFYAEVCRVLPSIADDWEIVFCDDASTDDTAVIIAGILKNDPYARAIHHARNLGIRQTFEDLYQAAQKDYVVLLPGDGQWPAEALHQALYAMGSHAAVVLARRDKQYTVFRAVNSWVFNALVYCCFQVDLYDIGAAKLWRRNVLQAIQVQSQSLFNEAERMIKAHRKGHTIGVVRINHRPRVAGQAQGAKLKNITATLADLIKFRLSGSA